MAEGCRRSSIPLHKVVRRTVGVSILCVSLVPAVSAQLEGLKALSHPRFSIEQHTESVPGGPPKITRVLVINPTDVVYNVDVFSDSLIFRAQGAVLAHGRFEVYLPLGSYKAVVSGPPGAVGKPNWGFQDVTISGPDRYDLTIHPLDTESIGAEPTSGGDTIDAAIDSIARGPHQDLPQQSAQRLAPGERTGWSVENGTGYDVQLYVSGPEKQQFAIPNGGSITINLIPGTYRIAATVSDVAVKPFYAVRQLEGQTRWASHFYIARQ